MNKRIIEKMISVKSVITAFDDVRPKNFYFPGEMHDFWELVCVLSGTAAATADEKVYSLSAGNILFHKPLEFHRIWSAEGTTPHILIISFEAEGEGMKYFEKKSFTLDSSECERIAEINADFRSILSSDGSDKYFLNETAVKFEAFLLGLYGRKHRRTMVKDKTASDFEQIVSYMNRHSEEALTLSDIARACNLSASNLKRIFHIYSDVGVMKYFASVRIRRAMKLIESGLTISEIAERLGFSSTNYFHNSFKRETGMTPTEYKAKNQ